MYVVDLLDQHPIHVLLLAYGVVSGITETSKVYELCRRLAQQVAAYSKVTPQRKIYGTFAKRLEWTWNLNNSITSGACTDKNPIKGTYRKNPEQIERIVNNYQNYKSNGQVIRYLEAIAYKIKLNSEEIEKTEETVEE